MSASGGGGKDHGDPNFPIFDPEWDSAADAAGMPVGAWVEQTLSKALEEGLEPGVSLEEIEARLRQVVADAVQPVQQALLRLPTEAPSSPVSLVRARMRQRRGR
jgi:hypothetical protein